MVRPGLQRLYVRKGTVLSQLVTNVHVAASGHQSQWFGPGDDIPAWAFEKLRHNPLLWDELPDDEPTEDSVESSVADGEYVLNAAATKADEAEADLKDAQNKAKSDLSAVNVELDEKPKPAPAKKAPARKAPAKKAAPKTAE